MKLFDIITESAAEELKNKLPSLKKHNYSTIDKLMRKISKHHHIDPDRLHKMFVNKYKATPDNWIKKYKEKLEENVNNFVLYLNDTPISKYQNKKDAELDKVHLELKFPNKKNKLSIRYDQAPINANYILYVNGKPATLYDDLESANKDKTELEKDPSNKDKIEIRQVTNEAVSPAQQAAIAINMKKMGKKPKNLKENKTDTESEVNKFRDWACEKLKLADKPEIELSYDTEQAQDGHHTGKHVMGENAIWVYAKNRNLVDILRTVFHELVHVKQGELGRLHHGSSYPGSPIESVASAMADKYMKIYGKSNPHIFQ